MVQRVCKLAGSFVSFQLFVHMQCFSQPMLLHVPVKRILMKGKRVMQSESDAVFLQVLKPDRCDHNLLRKKTATVIIVLQGI